MTWRSPGNGGETFRSGIRTTFIRPLGRLRLKYIHHGRTPIEPLVDAYWLFVRAVRLTVEEAEEARGCYRNLHSLVLTVHKAECEVIMETNCTASPSFSRTVRFTFGTFQNADDPFFS